MTAKRFALTLLSGTLFGATLIVLGVGLLLSVPAAVLTAGVLLFAVCLAALLTADVGTTAAPGDS